jgi:hypothetical protein
LSLIGWIDIAIFIAILAFTTIAGGIKGAAEASRKNAK